MARNTIRSDDARGLRITYIRVICKSLIPCNNACTGDYGYFIHHVNH